MTSRRRSHVFILCLMLPVLSSLVFPGLGWASGQDKRGPVYSSAELLGLGVQRVFEGAALKEIAFPLGGIGTGIVSLGGRGNLRDWEIFNRPGKGVNLPFTFFALYFEQEGKKLVRVLEGP
ncbi:MAG: GH116 family glycosyl-hydrolase, partial [Candidatus Aminicenantales bacterium]